MSTDYSSSTFTPTSQFGDLQDVQINLQNALVKEATDPVNSNFCLLKSSTSQTVKTALLLDPYDGDVDDNTNNAYNINRAATRKWCKNAYITNILDPHISSSDYTFTGAHVHSGDLRVTNDPTLANSVTRRSYVDAQDSWAVSTATAAIQANSNAFTGTNTFNSNLPTSTQTPSTGTQLVTKSYTDGKFQQTGQDVNIVNTKKLILQTGSTLQANATNVSVAQVGYLSTLTGDVQTQLNGKQNALSGSSTLTVGNLTTASITDTGNVAMGGDLSVTGNTTLNTVGINGNITANALSVTPSQLSYLSGATSNIQTQLAGKQSLITSATDISMHDLVCNNITCASGTIDYSEMTINDGILTIAKTSGLQSALDAKETIANVATGLATKQNVITDGSLTIARTSGLQTALDAKQDTLSSSSNIATGTITSEGLVTVNAGLTLPVTKNFNMNGNIICNSCTINPTELSYIDNVTSNIQTQIDSKQATLTNGSVGDSLLASTFVKTSTDQTITGIKTFSSPPVLSGASITSASIPTSAIGSGALTVTSLTCSSETDSGNATFGSISEKYTSIGNNGTANSYTLDYTGNTAVYILSTAPTANMTIRLNNCGTDTTKNITFAIIYNTTGKYYASTVTAYTDTSSQITLASSTPLYAGGSAPSISSSVIMVQTFTLIRNFASNYVMTNVATFA
jgi:hypothetical protein